MQDNIVCVCCVQDNVLGALGVSALCKCLGSNYYLKKIDLSENNFGPPTQLINPKTNEVELRDGAAQDMCTLLRESGSVPGLYVALAPIRQCCYALCYPASIIGGSGLSRSSLLRATSSRMEILLILSRYCAIQSVGCLSMVCAHV